jgi:hypothetical protein
VLLLNSTSDKLQVITGSAGDVDIHANWADVDAAGAITVGRLNSSPTTATTTDVVPSPAAGSSRKVKALHIANVHATNPNLVTIVHTDGTTAIQLESVNLLAGERMSYREGVGMRVIDSAGLEKVNPTIVSGQLPVLVLGADVSNATVTAAKITGLDYTVGPGIWWFEYKIIYTSSVVTTAAKVGVNHTGTVSTFAYDAWITTSDSAATVGNADQDMLVQAGGIVTGWAARAKSTTAPITLGVGVDTINVPLIAHISGVMIVSVSGNIELYHASETANATVIKAGTGLRLTKLG